MNNAKFQIELNKLARYNVQYKNQLDKCENEVKRRYGFFPAELDYDTWIDAFHMGIGSVTVSELDAGMKSAKELNKIK